jgi:signal transduction histidine kinase
MNGIIGMTELTLDPSRSTTARYLGMVRDSADALLSIINDVLDFSKIEAGKLDLDLINFHLREYIEDTVKALAVRVHQKGLELTYHIPPEAPDNLVGDAGRLRQIIINLVGNAIKFTSQGAWPSALRLMSSAQMTSCCTSRLETPASEFPPRSSR